MSRAIRRWWAPAALAAGAAVLFVLALSGGGDGGTDGRAEAPGPEPARVDRLAYPELGLRLPRPLDWTASREGDVVRLRSADDRMAVALATGRASRGAAGARRRAERAVQRGFRGVRVIARRARPVAGGPGQTAELVARRDDGALVDVLVVGAASRWRSYSITAISLRPTPRARLRQLAALLDGVAFTRP